METKHAVPARLRVYKLQVVSLGLIIALIPPAPTLSVPGIHPPVLISTVVHVFIRVTIFILLWLFWIVPIIVFQPPHVCILSTVLIVLIALLVAVCWSSRSGIITFRWRWLVHWVWISVLK
jgi:hypothetical protein